MVFITFQKHIDYDDVDDNDDDVQTTFPFPHLDWIWIRFYGFPLGVW